jgi:aryl-alcohol dehydrogenase-like predicted oxidoreductase
MFGDTIYQHDRRFGSTASDPTSSSCSHRSVAGAGLEDQMEALQRLKDQGKVRCVGLSNETPWGLMKCCQLAKQNQSTTTNNNNNNSSASASSEDIIGGGHHHHEGEGEKCNNKPKPKYAGVGYLQNAYNLLCRTFDTSGLSECCSEEDVGLLAYSPLAMGLLTGKYNKGNDFGGPPEARLNYYRGRYSEAEQRYERTTKVTEAVHLYADLALQCDMASPVELAIRFVLSHPNLASCIVGATTSAQLDEITRAAAKGPLPTEVLQQIDKIHTRNPNPAP